MINSQEQSAWKHDGPSAVRSLELASAETRNTDADVPGTCEYRSEDCFRNNGNRTQFSCCDAIQRTAENVILGVCRRLVRNCSSLEQAGSCVLDKISIGHVSSECDVQSYCGVQQLNRCVDRVSTSKNYRFRSLQMPRRANLPDGENGVTMVGARGCAVGLGSKKRG